MIVTVELQDICLRLKKCSFLQKELAVPGVFSYNRQGADFQGETAPRET
jgi:hypothetical protein